MNNLPEFESDYDYEDYIHAINEVTNNSCLCLEFRTIDALLELKRYLNFLESERNTLRNRLRKIQNEKS